MLEDIKRITYEISTDYDCGSLRVDFFNNDQD